MENQFPIGICKQACMKLDSFITDINEMKVDPCITEDTKYKLDQMLEYAGIMEACLVNIVHECTGDSDTFLSETIDMDDCGSYDPEPEEFEPDLMDIPIQ